MRTSFRKKGLYKLFFLCICNDSTSADSRGGKVDWAYHDKANSKTEKLKEQTVTQGGYTNKVSYDYNTLDQNIRMTDGSQTYRFDYGNQGNVRTYTAGK
nr:hypothetical protein [Bacillus wiedmannii]